MPSSLSLKPAQLMAVNRMLAFHDDTMVMDSSSVDNNDSLYTLPPAGSAHNQWKILVYDAPCRSIISPLLNVSQLRKRGVTLHLLLHSERDAIPDVPAIYFIQPTRENLQVVAQDCAKGLYSKVHLNFVTKLDRNLMEEFAKLIVQTSSLDKIASVHDLYLDYVCLEKDLFSLHKPDSYLTINGSNATESMIESTMNDIAYGLFSVVATLGQIPIIRCPKGGAPEMVARQLNRMIAEHPTLLSGTMPQKSVVRSHFRPLLVILDRNADLVTPIQHTSTYQALIDDLLQHNANRVEFQVQSSDTNKVVTKKYDLNADDDLFYVAHKFQPFPEAIESNGVELEQVTTREMEIRSKTGSVVQPTQGTTDLATAVDSLPALLERKKQLEVHTSILQAVMNQVAERDVPQFYELESSLATGVYKNDLVKAKQDVLELATDPTKGNVQDKLRLVVTYCLSTRAPSSDIEQVVNAMKEALESKPGGLDKVARVELDTGLSAVEYIKRLRSMHMISTMSEMQEISDTTSTTTHQTSDMLSSFMKSATNQATGLLAKATEKVGTMLGKIHKHPATRVVENLCDFTINSEDDDYLYLDPKVKLPVNVATLRHNNNAARAPVNHVICFTIGGGCYAEYQNLQMVANERRSVSYGSTELVNACDFMNQLAKLA